MVCYFIDLLRKGAKSCGLLLELISPFAVMPLGDSFVGQFDRVGSISVVP